MFFAGVSGRIAREGSAMARAASEVLFAFVILISFAAYWVLLGGYFAHVYEPDTSFSLIDSYVTAITNFSISALPEPHGKVPYFDADSILYAIFAVLLRMAGFWSAFSSKESVYIFSVYAVNIAIYSVGVGVFYRLCYRLSGSLLWSGLLAMMFAISPQILMINPLRIDYLIYPLIACVSYLCILMIQGGGSKSVGYSLGVVSAFLVATKVTGAAYLLLPFLSLALLFREKSFPFLLRGFLLSLIGMLVLLMARYLYHGALFYSFISGIAEVRRWSDIIPMEPWFFYNIDNFSAYGIVFLVLAFAAIGFLSFYAFFKKDKLSIFVLAPLVFFSLLLMCSPKLPRWGIVISFYYFLAIAVALSYAYGLLRKVGAGFRGANQALPIMFALLLLPSAYVLLEQYRAVYEGARHKAAAMKSTKEMPARWFKANADNDAVVCMIVHSDWSLPPLPGVELRAGPFNFPYLDPVLMGAFQPPELEDVSRECEYILIDQFHRDAMLGAFAKYGHAGMKNAWEEFWETRIKSYYEHHRFTTEYPEWSGWNLDLYVRKPR
ncbi:hypothetical protein [uncultured Thiodictyon sp.]|uniref:hypothetical protein n=1 Tax=uncultured Thiodictyon sp. TaxID=1846217 RepID=UPI0025DE4BAF|nr:hypothetical protein [uncultured Thiodictyon sp.]